MSVLETGLMLLLNMLIRLAYLFCRRNFSSTYLLVTHYRLTKHIQSVQLFLHILLSLSS